MAAVLFSLFAVALSGFSAVAQAQIVKTDGSSTVFPIAEAAAPDIRGLSPVVALTALTESYVPSLSWRNLFTKL